MEICRKKRRAFKHDLKGVICPERTEELKYPLENGTNIDTCYVMIKSDDLRLNIQNDIRMAKAYQAKQVLLAIEKLEVRRGCKKW